MDMQKIKAKVKHYTPEIIVGASVVAGAISCVYILKQIKANSEAATEAAANLEQAIVLFKDYGFPLFYDADNPSVFYDIQRVPQEVLDNIA